MGDNKIEGLNKMLKKPHVHLNQILKLPVNRIGKEGDAIFMYNNFIIFLKSKEKLRISLNEFVEIRITKILPKFALAVLNNNSFVPAFNNGS